MQDGHVRVVARLGRIAGLDVVDERARAVQCNECLVQQIFLVDHCPDRRIEDLFLHGGVDEQHRAQLLGQFLAFVGRGTIGCQGAKPIEQLGEFVLVHGQEIDGIIFDNAAGGMVLGHGNSVHAHRRDGECPARQSTFRRHAFCPGMRFPLVLPQAQHGVPCPASLAAELRFHLPGHVGVR
jgi:hypothetical protein